MNRETLKEKLYLEKEIKDLMVKIKKDKETDPEKLVKMLQNIKKFTQQEIQINLQK